jgi:hypothetical protein
MEESAPVSATSVPPRALEPPTAPVRVRRLCLLALLGAAVWFAFVGGLHIRLKDPDFEYFYQGGAWLLEHGSLDPGYDLVAGQVVPRGKLDWYWPCVPRVMTLFATLPFQTAGCVWLGLNLLAMLATLRLIGRHLLDLPPQDWPVTQLVPFLLLLFYWRWEFSLNQIDTLTLLLMVGSFVYWQRGRRVLGGFWLGLAILTKLTPGLLILWFALKRDFRTVGAAILTVGLAGPVADVVALGPEQTLASYRTWVHKAVATGSQRGLILSQSETDWRNQGLGVVLCRWLHPTSYSTHFDNDPRLRTQEEPRTLNIADWSLPAVARLATAIAIGTLAGLIWLARRPAGSLSVWQLRLEWALWMLAMLWLMPVMRRYHMIWALPAIALLAAGIHHSGRAAPWSRLALAALGLAAVAQLGMLWRPIEAGGVILASVAVLAVPLVARLWHLSHGGNSAGVQPDA